MREDFVESLNVSRETRDRLLHFEKLICKWSPRINLVSRQDLDHLWDRHILDSAQVVELSDTPRRWLDLGSGGGFPGIVVAIMMQDKDPSQQVTLVESDKRKCAFLKTVARSLDLHIGIKPHRVEDLESFGASTVSARALASLSRLIYWTHSHIDSDGTALFPKGKDWQNQLDQAKKKWSFECDVIQSVTDPDAAVLKIRNIQRK